MSEGRAVRQSGFTLVEYIIVLMCMGVLSSLAFPRVREAMQQTSVRSARAAVGILAAKARAVAVQRGCRSVLHFTSGPDGTVWVTACKTSGAGLDTLDGVERIASRFDIVLAATRDSVRFDSRGLNVDYQLTTVRLAAGDMRDSLMINQVGKVVR